MTQRPRTVRWEEMLPDELLDAIRAHPVCYLAYGLAEPHGAYNALGLDWLKAHALVERAALAHGGVVAPPFAWHVQERASFDWFGDRGVRQPLCSSIPEDLYLRMVLYQIRAVDARGFRALLRRCVRKRRCQARVDRQAAGHRRRPQAAEQVRKDAATAGEALSRAGALWGPRGGAGL